jgi:serine/threonine-protein kinase ATR
LSITVVKNLQTRPHMAEQLCDLLGMGVDDLLRLTEVHILPYLVLTRKRDIIMRIGASYQTAKSPFELCTEKNNLASILAFLLSQPSSDPEGMILSLFSAVDPEFQNRSLAVFLRTEPIPIARDLLKYLGDAGEDKESRVRHIDRTLPCSDLFLCLIVSSSSPCLGELCAKEVRPGSCDFEASECIGKFHRRAHTRDHH